MTEDTQRLELGRRVWLDLLWEQWNPVYIIWRRMFTAVGAGPWAERTSGAAKR